VKKRIHLKIHGQVQGVSFRHYTKQVANKLNLTGWVKNNSDGTVELIVEGEEQAINKLKQACQKFPSAKIDKIEENWSTCKNEFSAFNIEFL